jgi:hypothetical protein
MYYFGSLIANCNKFSTKLMMIYDENISIKHRANQPQTTCNSGAVLKLFTKILQTLLLSHMPECWNDF